MNIFLISDTHFSHDALINFKREDGSPLRPFKTIQENDEAIITNWNSVVKVEDKVYVLGDVTFKNTYLDLVMRRLKGTKILIKGNHDQLKLSQYAKWFKDVRSYGTVDKYILSHIPIHPESLSRWKANIHGHLHHRVLADNRYVNVSVEQINYTPIELSELQKRITV